MSTPLSKVGEVIDIIKITRENDKYRLIICNGEHEQIIAMNILSGRSIPMERHKNADQWIHIIEGSCKVLIGEDYNPKFLEKGNSILIPANTLHEVTNNGTE